MKVEGRIDTSLWGEAITCDETTHCVGSKLQVSRGPMRSLSLLMFLLPVSLAIGVGSVHAAGPEAWSERVRIVLTKPGQPTLALQHQKAVRALPRAEVVYVHGGTFGADLSVFFPFDGRSWADSLVGAGFSVWGFDFAGFGASDRYPAALDRPAGNIDAAMGDLRRVVLAARQRNGDRAVVLLAHSRGGAVAARYASEHPEDVAALVLFAPIVMRPAQVQPAPSGSAAQPAPAPPSHYPLSAWAQYRRFVEDVPKGQPQVLSEAHMQAWGSAFLGSDPTSGSRNPPAVLTPYGPIADIAALWSDKALYDPTQVKAPTLLIRGEWDSLCNDADAERLIMGLTSTVKQNIKVPRATHLMHLEQQRGELYAEVNRFLQEVLP